MAIGALNTGVLAQLGHMAGHEWGAGAWILGIIGFIVIVTLVVLVVYMLARSFSHRHAEGTPTGAYLRPPVAGDPLDIAQRRYAAGEITKEQFEEISKTLKGD